jgi:S1-C subfamily serine protease
VGGYVVSLGRRGASLGVVSSAPRRVAVLGRSVRRLLQTDAPLVGGNLGGPLIDLDGRVVGMLAPPVTSRGIGFAVPARELRQVLGRSTGTGRG